MERTCREGAHEVQFVELLESEYLYDWCQRFALSSGFFFDISIFHNVFLRVMFAKCQPVLRRQLYRRR